MPWLVRFCGVALFAMTAVAQTSPKTLKYAGVAGQQRVTLSLETLGEAVRGGEYLYDGQHSAIHFVDSRQFGTTLVLQDEDGGILHLHYQDAAGGSTGRLQAASRLEGTLDRAEVDLLVKLTRVEQKP